MIRARSTAEGCQEAPAFGHEEGVGVIRSSYDFTFEKDGFEVVAPTEPAVRVELTRPQLEAVMAELVGKGTLGGAWVPFRDACYAIGASCTGRRS